METTRRNFFGFMAATPIAAKKTAKEIMAKYGAGAIKPASGAGINIADVYEGEMSQSPNDYAESARKRFIDLLRNGPSDAQILQSESLAAERVEQNSLPPNIAALRSVSATHKKAMHLQQARAETYADAGTGNLREWLWAKENY